MAPDGYRRRGVVLPSRSAPASAVGRRAGGSEHNATQVRSVGSVRDEGART